VEDERSVARFKSRPAMGLGIVRQSKANTIRVAEGVRKELEHIRRSEYVDAYYLAILRAALGQREQAFAELDRAYDECSARLWEFHVDPKLDYFRSDPRYTRLCSALRQPAAPFGAY